MMQLTARILVVDDEADIRVVLHTMLTRAGYEVLECARGEPVLDVVRTEQPALVLLDVQLPDIDGLAVLAALRADPETDVPVMLVSAFATDAHIARGLAQGAVDYVVKPFRRDDLLARIDAVLTGSRSASPQPGDAPQSPRS
jgi:DNA-binding response OmpR family regulator